MEFLQHTIELFRQGRADEAAIACENRLMQTADDADALSLLAEIKVANGLHDRAAPLLFRLTTLRPHDAAAHRRLAATLIALGRAEDAVTVLRQAILLEPLNARAHNNLGQAFLQTGNLVEAVRSFEQAIRLQPQYAIAHSNLGSARSVAGDFDGALQDFERALMETPQLVDAWVGRGTTLAHAGRFSLALESFEKALSLRPNDAPLLTKKAFVMLNLNRPQESLDAADAAILIDAHAAEALNIRAGALRRLGRRVDALSALEQALALEPSHAEAWRNHSTVLHDMGEVERSLLSCSRALALDPDHIQTRTRLLARVIPPVPLNAREAFDARRTLEAQLQDFESWIAARDLTERDAVSAIQQQFFYLSYEETSNLDVLRRFRGLCAANIDKSARLSHSPGREAASVQPLSVAYIHTTPPRFRLGIVSAHIHDHSVFNAIVKGWLQRLDRKHFEIRLYGLGPTQDSVTRSAAAACDHADVAPRSLDAWVATLRGDALDAVIYPEIGMNETAMALAARRLAKRQYAAWGHPETSGLPSIDVYLSAALFEPDDAELHYSERLVCLPNLGVHCQRYGIEPTPMDRASFSGAGPVFVCPGVPFKYRPDDDRLLVDIAKRLGRCSFVFFQHELTELSGKLQRRISAAFMAAKLDPELYLNFIPWQPRSAFFGLMQRADVYLDTVGFSGFNTMMQAVECHLPAVAYEGRFMRGRLGSGILKRLRMDEWIAHDREEYVDLAVRLGASAAIREEVRDVMRSNEAAIYGDDTAVDALAMELLGSAPS